VLVDALVAQGDEVILYSIGLSTPSRRCLFSEEQEALLATPQRVVVEAAHALFAYDDAAKSEVTIIHDHSGYVGPTLGAFAKSLPVLCTLHKPVTEFTRQLYEVTNRAPHLFFSAISDHQRSGMAGLKVVATVHNAVDPRMFPLVHNRRDYLVNISRICSEKAPHRAIEVAQRAGIPLKLAGRLEQTAEGQRYFSERIQPMLGQGIEFVGEVDFDAKVELLGKAKALIFPVEWPEPFGLVVAEALACGTPVIATPRGGIPEIVRHGIEGFLTDDTDEMVAAVEAVGSIEPETCRKRIEERFNPKTMAAGYRSAYEEVESQCQKPR
jgi:glycosyltransferase involved in cell wall biosynthesis